LGLAEAQKEIVELRILAGVYIMGICKLSAVCVRIGVAFTLCHPAFAQSPGLDALCNAGLVTYGYFYSKPQAHMPTRGPFGPPQRGYCPNSAMSRADDGIPDDFFCLIDNFISKPVYEALCPTIAELSTLNSDLKKNGDKLTQLNSVLDADVRRLSNANDALTKRIDDIEKGIEDIKKGIEDIKKKIPK
jgi:hypothetical protein